MHLIIYIIIIFSRQQAFTISSIFANNHYIPANYSCSGSNVNPELRIKGIPQNTETLALIIEDPDPAFGTFDHWVMWNIPPQSKIAEDSAPGVTGRNSSKQNKYTGPCPPSGVHQYHFKLYALNTRLQLSDTSGKLTLLAAMKGHILAETELIGLFSK
ncbi:MAG: YbhB/YbcL family Raf kinase inhibitor-like protein [Bacteroidota bacterium]